MNHTSDDNMRNASPVQQHQKPHTPEKDSKPVTSGNGHVSQNNGLSRMSSYSLEVKLEAVDRIQTQVNLNRAQLETCTREINKITATMDNITIHYNTLLERMKQWEDYVSERQKEFTALRQEVTGLRSNAPAAQTGERMDDKALEILSNNLATVSSKANEVDNLKITLELVKRRLARIEEQNGFPPPSQRDPLHQQLANAPQASPPTMSHPQQETRAPTSYHPTESRHAEAEAQASWQNANQSKRPHVNGVETPHTGGDSPSKRPRLAPLEPRRNYEDGRYDPARPNEEHYRRESGEGYSEHAQQQHYAQYHEREDEAYRAGSAGRGARPRKYPGQERTSWATPAKVEGGGRQVVMDGHIVSQGPDGQWYQVTADSSRRSSLAGPQGPTLSPATTQQSPSNAGQILSQTPRDPYAHTKKTRTKPVRNSEGVLIRKDGRPDMRSQSSAANLRKVHARKEEERRLEAQQRQRAASSQIGDRGDGASEMADEASAASTPQHMGGRRHHHHHIVNDYDGEDEDGEGRPGSRDGPQEERSAERAGRQMYPMDVEQGSYSRSEGEDRGSSARSVSSQSREGLEQEVEERKPEEAEISEKDANEEEGGSKK